MHHSSIFNIRIDFEKSHGSYIYDKNTRKYFLDFFGLYATLPLGYNHPIFHTESFRQEYNRIASLNVPNCEIISDEAQEFLAEFSGHPAMADFTHFHFCCTGALAIEAAIKIAIDQKKSSKPMVISLKESFHGINSYGGFVTDRFSPVNVRLDGFPEIGWAKIHNPKNIYRQGAIDSSETRAGLSRFEEEFENLIRIHGEEHIAALLIEPIQSTYGDNYFPEDFFHTARRLCDRYKVCLIFDEIQTGFGVTGKMWYFQNLGIVPDVVAFGKKAQVSGVMAKKDYGETFKVPVRLEVTWDGSLTCMVQCKYILRAYDDNRILDNVRQRSSDLLRGLQSIPQFKNVRGIGLLAAFDFETGIQRDEFAKRAVSSQFIFNKTRDKTARLRPNLNVSEDEIRQALAILEAAVMERV